MCLGVRVAIDMRARAEHRECERPDGAALFEGAVELTMTEAYAVTHGTEFSGAGSAAHLES
jgi:hypothetical protein